MVRRLTPNLRTQRDAPAPAPLKAAPPPPKRLIPPQETHHPPPPVMKLGVALALCALLAAGRAGPMNYSSKMTSGLGGIHFGPCYLEYTHCKDSGALYCPECDADGYFLPKQCWLSRCWCVDVHSGRVFPHTDTMLGAHLECGANMDCPQDWHYYDGRCFLFVESPKPWGEAELYCQFYTSNLASVHSRQEYHYLQELTIGEKHFLKDAWLGGHNMFKPDFWMWCDGSKFYNEYWCHEDQAMMANSCLRMNYGVKKKWAAGNCSEPLPFFCSKFPDDYYYYYMMKDQF